MAETKGSLGAKDTKDGSQCWKNDVLHPTPPSFKQTTRGWRQWGGYPGFSHPLISSQNFPLAQPGRGAQEKQFAGDEQSHLKANEQCIFMFSHDAPAEDLLGKAKKYLASSPGLRM